MFNASIDFQNEHVNDQLKIYIPKIIHCICWLLSAISNDNSDQESFYRRKNETKNVKIFLFARQLRGSRPSDQFYWRPTHLPVVGPLSVIAYYIRALISEMRSSLSHCLDRKSPRDGRFENDKKQNKIGKKINVLLASSLTGSSGFTSVPLPFDVDSSIVASFRIKLFLGRLTTWS